MDPRRKRMYMLVTAYLKQIPNASESPSIIDLIFEFYKRDVIVMDFGSTHSKVGFAGYDSPNDIFPTIIGRPLYNSGGMSSFNNHMMAKKGKHSMQTEVYFVGNETKAKRGLLSLKYPVEHGIICDWNDMQNIMRYTFKSALEISSKGSEVLMAEAPLNPKAKREKMTQIMFEIFEVNRFCLKMQSCLALYASGRTTGIIVDSGESVTFTVPVYEGYALRNAINRMNIAGCHLTDYLRKLLTERYSLDTSSEREIARNIKETMAYVAYDYDEEMRKCETSCDEIEQRYKLSDIQIITLRNERFRCTEPLFNPSMIGLSQAGIHDLVHDSIFKCNADIRKILFSNIVLEGSSTMLPGFGSRLKKEMVQKRTNGHEVDVISPTDRCNSVWIGGSLLISMEDCEEMWITKEEYDEYGPFIVQRKCF